MNSALYFALVYAEPYFVQTSLLIQKPIMQFCAFQEPAKGMRSVSQEGRAIARNALATKSLGKNAFVAL